MPVVIICSQKARRTVRVSAYTRAAFERQLHRAITAFPRHRDILIKTSIADRIFDVAELPAFAHHVDSKAIFCKLRSMRTYARETRRLTRLINRGALAMAGCISFADCFDYQPDNDEGGDLTFDGCSSAAGPRCAHHN